MCCYAKVFQVHDYQFNKDKVKTFDLTAKLTKWSVMSHMTFCVNFSCPYSPQLNNMCHMTKFYTLDLCFLLMAGDAGWPGLGTPLEAADPAPEWRRAERSSADSTPRPPDPIPGPTIPGACCWDTFCSSAANCFGSTPGERCPPAQRNGCTEGSCTRGVVKKHTSTRQRSKDVHIPALSGTWCSRACGCSGSDSIFRSLFGSIQEMDGYLSTSVISH